MTFCYKLFGFSAVSNRLIPGLTPRTTDGINLRIALGHAPPASEERGSEELMYTSTLTTSSGEPAFRLFTTPGEISHLVYSDGAEFWLDAAAGRIWATWPETLTLDGVAPYLLGPVFGLLLRLRGVVCLHASAILLYGQAVLFLGDPGAGKSTTAAAMSSRGRALIADDIVGIVEREGQFFAIPAFPYVSLWPQSAEMICGANAGLPSLFPGFEKRRFTPSAFQESPVPIGVIFLLGERSCGENLPRSEEMAPSGRLLALVANSYATRTLSMKSRADEFRLFGRMVEAIPVSRLFAHSDPARLTSFCDCIEKECRRLATPAFA